MDVLAVLRNIETTCFAAGLKVSAADASEARAAVADAMLKSEAVWQILLNQIEAGNVSEGYRQHAKDCRAALARIGGA